jgi:hypothetical protein
MQSRINEPVEGDRDSHLGIGRDVTRLRIEQRPSADRHETSGS